MSAAIVIGSLQVLRRRRRLSCALSLAAIVLGFVIASTEPAPAQRRWVVALANVTEEPGVTLEGTGFTGPDIAGSFNLAARMHPIDLLFYDNHRDDARAIANADAAIARKVDLYIQYHRGSVANATIAQKLKAAGIPILAINHPVPGAPLYTIDNAAAGRAAAEALVQFATRSWTGQPIVAVVIGRVSAAAWRARPSLRIPNRKPKTPDRSSPRGGAHSWQRNRHA